MSDSSNKTSVIKSDKYPNVEISEVSASPVSIKQSKI